MCPFEEICYNEGSECECCQYNPESCTKNFFDWNGQGTQPTEDELDKAIQN